MIAIYIIAALILAVNVTVIVLCASPKGSRRDRLGYWIAKKIRLVR